MKYPEIAKRIIILKQKDDALRQKLIELGELSKGYNPEMERLHISNAIALESIIDETGFPCRDKVGQDAANSAWIVVQHSISRPSLMKRYYDLMKDAVASKKANPVHLAYLSDRINVFQDKPQLYGTQYDWDENGKMSPKAFDNLDEVNKRREELGLNTVQEQTRIMRKRVVKENQKPPSGRIQHLANYNGWRKKVGWL